MWTKPRSIQNFIKNFVNWEKGTKNKSLNFRNCLKSAKIRKTCCDFKNER